MYRFVAEDSAAGAGSYPEQASGIVVTSGQGCHQLVKRFARKLMACATSQEFTTYQGITKTAKARKKNLSIVFVYKNTYI